MKSLTIPQVLKLKNNSDSNGNLVALEELKNVPFSIKRVFYIYKLNEGVVRGQHANKTSDFMFISLMGSCKVKYYYQSKFYEISLNEPTLALYLPKMVWKDMYEFSPDCVLLVLTNHFFDPNEYIRDFKVYQKMLRDI
jgi:dTDP-4-dehydrorhamnose 3,5-epimerase-like enzyme